MSSSGHIAVRGARQNNLKNLSFDLPLGQFIVITGLSGSGKSSLAFDTLYSEGQRRYTETFSPYTRQFLERMDKPQVDRIEGIPPAIAIAQANSVRTSRSTVGTMTEVADYLKMLFPRMASLTCPKCGKPIRKWSPQDISADLLQHRANETVLVTFEVPFPSKTTWQQVADFLRPQGFLRIFHNGAVLRIDDPAPKNFAPASIDKKSAYVEVIQDRVTLNAESKPRLGEALHAALAFGKGVLGIRSANNFKSQISNLKSEGARAFYSSRFYCPSDRLEFPAPTPGLFAFNSPIGACPTCKGFGRMIDINYDIALPDRTLSIDDGVVKPWQTGLSQECQNDLLRACKKSKVPIDIPFFELSQKQQDWVIYGDNSDTRGQDELSDASDWYGVKGYFNWLETKSYKMHVRVLLSRYRSYTTCSDCKGTRLKPEVRQWKLGGLTLPEINDLPLKDLHPFFVQLQSQDDSTATLLEQIRSRLHFLIQVGLGYLTLNRSTRTLSGGETQRVNLTTCLGTSLVGTLFILDEPSIGLHSRDTTLLIEVLRSLARRGNTVVVVEHDEEMIRAADYILELGPSQGEKGGHLVYQGHMPGLLKSKASLTGAYLTGRKSVPLPQSRRSCEGVPKLEFTGARKHNLKDISFSIPLGKFTAITGVSGSGKSTLVHDIIHKHLLLSLKRPVEEPGALRKLKGADKVVDAVLVDQTPLTQTPRSTALLYLGVYDNVRELFAMTESAQSGGYNASSFSFNSGNGRCLRCSGTGYEKISMQFLSDIYVKCPVCEGTRFQPELLQVEYRGASIHDILEMTVQDALVFFSSDEDLKSQISNLKSPPSSPAVGEALRFPPPASLQPSAFGLQPLTAKQRSHHATISNSLQLLADVGLSYIKLGQPLNQLSGGEAQRLKLVSHLHAQTGSGSRNTGKKSTVLILDEPTTGLHLDDIRTLMQVLQRLVDLGHTLIVIEHNLEVIKGADWIIDLGPEAGAAGGELIAQGPPEAVAKVPRSLTGSYLLEKLNPDSQKLKSARLREESLQPSALSLQPYRQNAISIRGARHHNLKNINIDVPLNKMVVLTGLSGSGKSSLAFDLLFAEGQRRYLDCLNTYARQFVEQMEKPQVDSITGIPPAVAIEQRTTRGGSKSTVATVTEIYHFLRLLYAKLGVQHDPETDEPAIRQTPQEITKRLMESLRKHKELTLLAPLIRARKGYHTELARWAERKEYPWLRADGKWIEPAAFKALDRFKEHTIDVVLGNITEKTERLPELISQALHYGKGTIYTLPALDLENPTNLKSKISDFKSPNPLPPLRSGNFKFQISNLKSEEEIYSTSLYCPSTGRSFNELDPRQFSFNSPHGWCPTCMGYGNIMEFNIEADTEAEREQLTELARESAGDAESVPCPECHGARLNEDSRSVRFEGYSIPLINKMTVSELDQFIGKLKFNDRAALISRDLIPEIRQRLHFLAHVGLDYLNLDRGAPTLSGGESQRIRLAAQLGSNLQGVLYVLDEPTIGLHPRDNERLVEILQKLKERGNSLIVVEHDEDTMRSADHIIDMGPGAGINGGEVVAQGSWKQLAKNTKSITGMLLGDPMAHPSRGSRRPIAKNHGKLSVEGAFANNLKNVDIDIPLQRLTVLTGVSGSGKSTLMRQVVLPSLNQLLARKKKKVPPVYCKKISGTESIEKVVEMDQSPIGKTSRSTVCTYIGLMDPIRQLFAALPEAKVRGFEAGHFSYNAGAGRCPTCMGQGMIKVEMNFMPTVYVPCETCGGKRYRDEILSIQYKEKSIYDVLQLSIDEAVEFFSAHPKLTTPLALLKDTGLGYLKLGQTSPTLSGGEAQRLKLVYELSAPAQMAERMRLKRLDGAHSHYFYLLEEPTVGLHLADVKRLLDVLHRLVDSGHTVVVIEHNLDVMAEADHIIDIGPESGPKGGEIVCAGTPEEVVKNKKSHTARYLSEALSRSLRK